MGWKPADKIAVALFNFDAQNGHHLSLQVGDLLYILEETPEWYRGYLYHQPSKRGIFPASFVKTKENTTIKSGSKRFVVPAEDEVALEAKEVLREWRTRLTEFYVSGSRDKYRQLLHFMEDVLSWRRNILHSSATFDVLHVMRTKLTAKIDLVNEQLDYPLNPRNENGKLLQSQQASMNQLYTVHQERAAEIAQQVSQTGQLHQKSSQGFSSHVHHLCLQVGVVDHQFPEDCEIFFFLYDHARKWCTSERYTMLVAKSTDKARSHDAKKHTAVFTDLGSKDLDGSSLHLVCQIIRKGKMLLDDKKNVAHNPYRRPYACGVLDLELVLQEKQDEASRLEDGYIHSFTMPLYLCSANHESNFATFHTNVINKTGAKGGQKPGCAITISLRTLHGKLAELKSDYPLLFTKSTEVVRKLGFPDIIVPGDTRNDIYVTLEHGQFEKGSKRAERNVEVSVEAVDNQGSIIPRAIILGAGTPPVSEYESFIYYHNNTPKWNETFKLSIPFERLPDAHLRIGFRHVAKSEAKEKADKTFAFTYMKIMKEDGSIVEDGTQELYVYKAEGRKWYDPRIYLHHPSCKEDVISQRSSRTYSSSKTPGNIMSPPVQIPRSFRESIHISTLTCSTKLTQKIELLLLLKWRQKQRDLKVVLTNIMHIDVEEVVKFLQDTLNCLFEILSTDSNKYGEHVFDTLVTIFSVMQAERYQHFTTVLDIYIKEHFSAVLTHKFLIHCFERNVISYYKVKELHPKLIRMFKSMEYLFKFMVQSHILFMSQQKQDDPEFRSDVKRTFQAFGSVVCVQENKMKGVYTIQSPLLQNLPRILPELARMFTEVDVIASLLSEFLNSIRNTHATLPGDKLDFILCLLNSPVKLLETEASHRFLVPTLVSHMVSHMDHMMPRTNYKPEDSSNKICLACIGRLLDIFAEKRETTTFQDIEHVVPLIFPLLRLCKVIPKTNPLAQPNLVNFIGLLDVMQDEHFATLFDSQKSTYENALKEFLMDLMRVLKNVITNPPYPSHWATLYLAHNRVVGRVLQNISKALLDGFLRATDFNPQIWDHFFNLCTLFLTQPCLQLESFSDFRRHQFQQRFGDMRLTVGRHVVVMWHALKEKKGNFIPDLIGSLLEMTLLKQRELRRLSLPVVFDVMKCEQMASTNFKRVETEVFDKMDDLVSKGKGDEEYKEMFHDILIPLCSSGSQCPELEGPGTTFIDSVCRLIALLLDYRSVSADEHHKGRRMGCILNLLNFYREIEKEELYIRYIYRLAELHEHDQSYTEAGFTLLLHGKGLEWSSEKLHAVGRYPEQTARERKERLYHDVIRLFDRGKTWECGVPLCKELAKIYETELFDYQQLASILQKEAEFFQKIIRELRVEPEYFMVGYYGKGFPLFLRNKVFIHRGQTFERLGSFIRRLTEEFSTAQILKTTTPPDADVQNSTGMHLQVRTVHPMTVERELFKGKRVPDKIAEYYRTNDVQKFRYDRPFHRGQKDPQCEFATLWIERTTFLTAQSFPGVISWFEVSSTETVELNPLDIALETLGSKNREIQTLTSQYQANKTLNINPLSMLLNGVIDAAVMGGLSNYEKIFFNEIYLKEHPNHADGVKRLRTLIEEQITILEKALNLHKQRIDVSLQGLHSKLETCFEEVQGVVFPEKRKMTGGAHPAVKLSRAATLSRPLPPTPFEGPQDIPISQQAKRMSGTHTLPGKIVRRATGIPGKMKVHQVISEEPEPPRKPVKRSATTRQNSQTGLSIPISSSYSPRKAHSPSPGRDGLDVAGAGRGLAGSRQSSTGSLDNLSEDDRSNYERVDDFLGGSDEGESRIRSIPSPAPTYPAPSLPDVPIVDHDYEPVILGSRLSPSTSDSNLGYAGDKERTTLPFVFANRTGMVVGAGRHTPVKKSVSDVGAAASPPKAQERERSPSLPTVKEKVTEQKHVTRKKNSWADIPPEPTSPPPSPPRNIFSPTEVKQESMRPLPPHPIASKQHTPPRQPQALDDAVYAFDRLGNSPEPDEPQPKLPPKLRKMSKPVVKDDEVYAFDTLDPKEQKTPEGGGIREDVYFDHLFDGQEEEPAAQVTTQGSAGAGGGGEGGKGEGNEPYFDHLFLQEGEEQQQESGPPQGPGESQSQGGGRSDPQSPGGGQSEPQPQGGDAVYFDHLIEDHHLQQPPQKTPQAVPQPYTSYMPSERSVSPESSAKPPPVPLKRSKTTRHQTHGLAESPATPSYHLAESPATPSYLTEVEVGDRPKPVPRPRVNTLERNRLQSTTSPKDREDALSSSSGDYGHLTQVSTGRGAPAIPPKPLPPPTLPPSLPPKPSKPPQPSKPPLRLPRQEQNGDSQPPPIPSKPSKWKSSGTVKR